MSKDSKQLVLIGNSVSEETREFFSETNGFQPIPASIGEFPSGEPYVELFYKQEDKWAENAALLKGQNVIAVQSGGAPYAKNIMNLLLMIDTLKSYEVASVTAYVQMLPLARQDRKFDKRFVSEGAWFMAKTLETAEVDKIITVTPHSQACIQTFKSFFGDNFIAIDASELFAADIRKRFGGPENIAVGAPDGADKPADEGQRRAGELSHALFGEHEPSEGRFKIAKEHIPGTMSDTQIVGFDEDLGRKVYGKDCILIDDMIDGGGTMVNAAALLKESGAKSVTCYATHGLLTGNALEKMLAAKDSPIDKIVITDTVPDAREKLADFARKHPSLSDRIEVLCTASLLIKALAPKKNVRPAAKPASRFTP